MKENWNYTKKASLLRNAFFLIVDIIGLFDFLVVYIDCTRVAAVGTVAAVAAALIVACVAGRTGVL